MSSHVSFYLLQGGLPSRIYSISISHVRTSKLSRVIQCYLWLVISSTLLQWSKFKFVLFGSKVPQFCGSIPPRCPNELVEGKKILENPCRSFNLLWWLRLFHRLKSVGWCPRRTSWAWPWDFVSHWPAPWCLICKSGWMALVVVAISVDVFFLIHGTT